jgi:hypothetical protein
MKCIRLILLSATVLTGVLGATSSAQDQSLGDYARHVRKDKDKHPPAAKKFDNDNLPKNDKLSVVGNPPEEAADKPADAAAQGSDRPAASPGEKTEEKLAQSEQDRQKGYEQWKQKISGQKAQIDLLTREMDVLQREYRLRAAAFYADAGDRLRNSASWDQQDRQYKEQIAQKQKALDSAKQQLQEVEEQARKAGVPSSMRQ